MAFRSLHPSPNGLRSWPFAPVRPPLRLPRLRLRFPLPALLLLPFLLLQGCAADDPSDAAEGETSNRSGSPASTFQVTDDRGHRVALEAPARRIISIIPSMTELIVELEGREHLVARTRYDRDPALDHLPSLGGTVRPNLEAIASLEPDLVIAWSDEEHAPISRRLRSLGIPVYHASIQKLDDLRRHTGHLGRLMDQEARADRFLNDLDERLDAVRASVPDGPRPTVLYIIWHDPPQTAGPGTFLDELIELAGGENLFADTRASWPRISMEEIIRRSPDVVVAATRHDGNEADESWLGRPGWREVSAVREGRVLSVNGDLFNRPGPRLAEAAETLRDFLAEGSDTP